MTGKAARGGVAGRRRGHAHSDAPGRPLHADRGATASSTPASARRLCGAGRRTGRRVSSSPWARARARPKSATPCGDSTRRPSRTRPTHFEGAPLDSPRPAVRRPSGGSPAAEAVAGVACYRIDDPKAAPDLVWQRIVGKAGSEPNGETRYRHALVTVSGPERRLLHRRRNGDRARTRRPAARPGSIATRGTNGRPCLATATFARR